MIKSIKLRRGACFNAYFLDSWGDARSFFCCWKLLVTESALSRISILVKIKLKRSNLVERTFFTGKVSCQSCLENNIIQGSLYYSSYRNSSPNVRQFCNMNPKLDIIFVINSYPIEILPTNTLLRNKITILSYKLAKTFENVSTITEHCWIS